jgi:hypothetical protein
MSGMTTSKVNTIAVIEDNWEFVPQFTNTLSSDKAANASVISISVPLGW